MSKRLGLVIGNSVYRDATLARLAAPDVDVGDLADVLLDPEIGLFDDVKVVVNTSSTTVRRAISDFFSGKDRDDLLFLYFSCHGVLDENGRLYLAFKDTERSLLRATGIPAAYITEEMNASRSQRQVLVLDCCHSGAFARGAKGTVGATVGTAAAFEGTGYGRVVLTATDATQYAWEGDRTSGEASPSVFTRHLVQGLQSGEADTDRDGRITIDELFDYVFPRVVKEDPRQTPGKWSYKEQGEMVIAFNPNRLPPVEPGSQGPAQDEELEQRVAHLYTRGLSAYWLEEWDRAETAFQSILDTWPEYKDTQDKLNEVRRQKKLAGQYQQALDAASRGDWTAAVASLESVGKESPGYKDVAARLAEARKQKDLASLYAQAQHLYQARQWQAAVRVFDKIHTLDPSYPDPSGLLSQAQHELDAQQRQQELEEHYTQALQAMETGGWEEARRLLLGLQEQEPAYADTQRLLARVEAELVAQAIPTQPQQPEQTPPALPSFSPPPATAAGAAAALPLAGTASAPAKQRNWKKMLWSPREHPAQPSPAGQAFRAVLGRLPRKQQSGQAAAPEAQQVSVAAIGKAIAARSLWLILGVSGSWMIPAIFFYLGKAGEVTFPLLFILHGALFGMILWFFLKRLSLNLVWKQALALTGGWAFSSALTIGLLISESIDIAYEEPLTVFLIFTICALPALVVTSLVIRPHFPTHPIQRFIATVATGALGYGLGGALTGILTTKLYDFTGGYEGFVLAFMLGFGIAGLLVAGALANRLERPDGLSSFWKCTLAGAAGFAIGELLARQLAPASWVYDDAMFAHLGIVGAIGSAFIGLPTRSARQILQLGILGLAGMILGFFLSRAIFQDYEFLGFFFWSIGLGLALGLSARSLPAALVMSLVGLAAMTVFWILLSSVAGEDLTSSNMFIASAGLGAMLAAGWSFITGGFPASSPAK